MALIFLYEKSSVCIAEPLRDDVSKSRTRGGHSNENSNQFLKPWYTLGFRGR